MGNFNRDTSSRGRGGYNDRSETFKATCSSCGRECDLPFKPNGSRPVFCRDCFRKNSNQDSGGRRDQSSDRRGGTDRPMYDAVCDNCGDKCRIPFMPREGKETLCSKCFEEKGGDPRRTNNTQGSAQLDAINAKLDRILNLLTPTQKPPMKEKQKVDKAPEVSLAVAEEMVPVEDQSVTEIEATRVKKPKSKKKLAKKA